MLHPRGWLRRRLNFIRWPAGSPHAPLQSAHHLPRLTEVGPFLEHGAIVGALLLKCEPELPDRVVVVAQRDSLMLASALPGQAPDHALRIAKEAEPLLAQRSFFALEDRVPPCERLTLQCALHVLEGRAR